MGARATQPSIVSSRPKVATPSANHWPKPLRTFERELKDRQVEHQMRRPDAEHATDDLAGDKQCRGLAITVRRARRMPGSPPD